MIIKKEHALALLNIKSQEQKGLAYQITGANEKDPYVELELQNLLVQGNSPIEYVLTYWGRNLVYLLEEMINKGLIDHPSIWHESFRWIGSEVISMIESSIRSGDLTGDLIFDALKERGLAEEVHEKNKGWLKKINKYAKSIYEIYKNTKPRLEISKELARYITSIPPGPTDVKFLPVTGRNIELLESMRLISFSVPKSDVYILSALGTAVKETIEKMAPSLETVINEDYMYSLLKVLDSGIESLTMSEREVLEELAFIDDSGELLQAGEHLIEVYRLWSEKSYLPVKTFNLEVLEEEILLGIEKVWDKNKQNPEIIPTDEEIVHFLLEKPLNEYKHLKEWYGRMLNQIMGYQKKEELKKKWEEFLTIKDLFRHFWEKGNEWQEKLYDTVKMALYSLEAFNLINSEVDEKTGKRVYTITQYGKKVLEDVKTKNVREITSTAVKSLAMSKTEFIAPNYEWYQKSVEEHLVGEGYPTETGKLYLNLAYNISKKPYVSKFEAAVIHRIPEQGMFIEDLYKEFDETLKEEIGYALNKLEAKGFINILPNNGIEFTPAGSLIKKALAGVPEGIGFPINPVMVKVLKAIKEVGNLYAKENKVRILPKNWKEALKISNLDPETFEKELEVARVAGFIGKTSLHESGLQILEAAELLNK